MNIEVLEFETGSGVRFKITADGTTEEVLLDACVDEDGPLVQGEEDSEFLLTIPVLNG